MKIVLAISIADIQFPAIIQFCSKTCREGIINNIGSNPWRKSIGIYGGDYPITSISCKCVGIRIPIVPTTKSI